MEISNVIDKVKHLMLLAQKAGTEAEAANASRHAQALMMKYRISTVDLQEIREDDSIKTNAGPEGGYRIAVWKSNLLSTICSVNGCRLIISRRYAGYSTCNRKTYQEFQIIGTESDATLCKEFYNYLCNLIENLTITLSPPGLARGEGKNWANSFKLGCTSTICLRLREGYNEAKKQASVESSTALMVINNRDKDVAAFVAKLSLGTKAVAASNVNGSAYRAGCAAGQKATLTSKVLKD